MAERAAAARPQTIAVAVLVALLAAFTALRPLDPAIFERVVVGRHVLAQQAPPTTDVWSAVDPTQPFHPSGWRMDAACAWLDAHGGLASLRLGRAALAFLGVLVLALVLRRRRRARAVALGTAALVALVALAQEARTAPSAGALWSARAATVDERRLPSFGAQLLLQSNLEARVATVPEWGGYLLYVGYPRLRTTVDGRGAAPEPVRQTTRAISEALRTGQGLVELPRLYDSLPGDFLLVPSHRYASRMALPGWIKIASGPVEDLYLRRSPDAAATMEVLRKVIENHRLAGIAGHVR